MNIYEIAAEAGVSISTVSRVLNNPGKVTPATRKRVQDVLDKCHYVPNAMARGLVQNSMRNIGILATDIRFTHFSITTHFLEEAFFNWGYSTLLCLTGDAQEKKEQYIRMLSEKKIDGIVLVGSVFSTSGISKVVHAYLPNTPIVIINGQLSGNNIYTVSLDHDHGMNLLVDHLIQQGYENIYFVRTIQSQNTARKTSAFIKTMHEKNLRMNEENNVYLCEYNYESIYRFAESFISLTRKKTAVIFSDDLMAGYACNAFQRLGCVIPKDVAISGYDNTNLTLVPNPQITSLDTQIETIANLAANTLRDVLTKKATSHGIMVLPELAVRESTLLKV